MDKIHTKIITALKRKQSMEKAIELLRSLNFYFQSPEVNPARLYAPHKIKYGWMIFNATGKWHWDGLQFGIKMWGKKTNKIIVAYQHGYVETIPMKWKDKSDINFRKITVRLKFPEYLNYDERRTWRTEYHKQLRDPNRIPSASYLKILPDIQFI